MKYDTGIFLCVGRRGTGKTTLLRNLISDLLRDGRHIALIYDPRAQIERPFLMPPRNPAVLFTHLEFFQYRISLFPCEFARIT